MIPGIYATILPSKAKPVHSDGGSSSLWVDIHLILIGNIAPLATQSATFPPPSYRYSRIVSLVDRQFLTTIYNIGVHVCTPEEKESFVNSHAGRGHVILRGLLLILYLYVGTGTETKLEYEYY